LSDIWALGDYEQIATRFAPIHDRLVTTLAPRAGERWLDVATGTGEVALRAARAGANVTALDFSEPLLEQAREKADAEGIAVELVHGDAQSLPFDDASFDIVSSSFGIIFPPDRDAVASELARVTRPGGRLGLTVWRPREGQAEVYAQFIPPEEAPPNQMDWGRDGFVEALLGDRFELEVEDGVFELEGESPEELFEYWTTVAPPTIALLGRLSPEKREEYRRLQIAYWQQFVGADGRTREPWQYLLYVGRRR
jgi:ubiquinone/menaquinone biosynthesis C-methylase UbiE